MSRKPRQSRTKPAIPAKPLVPVIAEQVDPQAVEEADTQEIEPAAGQVLISAIDPIGQQDGEQATAPATEPADLSAAMPPDERDDQPVAAPVAPSATQPSAQYEPDASDIRGVLIQLSGARLLLPNANIAEVLSYAPPEPVEAAPEWLLGKMRWRGWQLPLVAFAELAGFGKEPAGLGSKVVVLKALAGDAKAPYFAILTQGFPRLVTVSQQGLQSDAESADLPRGVQARVRLNEDTALVPDLEAVEGMINDALAKAA